MTNGTYNIEVRFEGGLTTAQEAAFTSAGARWSQIDSSNPSEPIEGPALKNADEWGSWFQKHPNLDTSKPVPMSVGANRRCG